MSAMKIGSGQFDVAQSRNLDHIIVADRFRDLEAAAVIRRQELPAGLLGHSKRSIHPAANIDAVVARRAPFIDEYL